jgi:hypothetical protein
VKKLFSLIFALILVMVPLYAANAAWTQYQTSPADTYNRPDLTAEFDLTTVSFAVTDTAPDEYVFFLNFTKPISANLFADSVGSWAGILLDLNLDGNVDYSLQTTTTNYEGNYFHAGKFVDRRNGTAVTSSLCAVKTWSNLDKQAAYIGFSIPKNCLPFGSQVSIQGYADQNANDNQNFDFAPDNMWTFNLAGGSISSNPPGTSLTDGLIPTVNSLGSSSISAPDVPPSDLVSLAANLTPSIVTVLCGNSLGSGWSINVDLDASHANSGYKSLIITNHHVIDGCTSNRNIQLVLSNQSRVSAYVYVWDSTNDLAGILTGTYIPPLNWRGATPEQGWWAGIIGSPLGFPGILTTGVVSSLNSVDFSGTTTAPINPGNSGGPVFDHTGRVIGLATAKYVDAENFGIFKGTPLLCQMIIKCGSTNQIWMGNTVVKPIPTPTPTPSPTPIKITKSKQSINDWGLPPTISMPSSGTISFSLDATSHLDPVLVSKTESVCLISQSEIVILKSGRCIISASQSGDDEYFPAPTKILQVLISSPKTTITCVKGRTLKKISGVHPKCPSGYKKK